MIKKMSQILISLFSSVSFFSLKGNTVEAIICVENQTSQSESDKYVCRIPIKSKKSKLGYLDKNVYEALKNNNKIIVRPTTEGSETGSKTTNSM